MWSLDPGKIDNVGGIRWSGGGGGDYHVTKQDYHSQSRPRGPAWCHQTSYANIKSYTKCHNIITGLLPIMPICLMILFSHLYVGSVVYGMTLYRWSLTFLDVKLVLTLPMSFNIWLRLFKVIKLWSSQMRISTWRYYWWSICHLLMSAWCAALRKESSSKYPV